MGVWVRLCVFYYNSQNFLNTIPEHDPPLRKIYVSTQISNLQLCPISCAAAPLPEVIVDVWIGTCRNQCLHHLQVTIQAGLGSRKLPAMTGECGATKVPSVEGNCPHHWPNLEKLLLQANDLIEKPVWDAFFGFCQIFFGRCENVPDPLQH